MCVCVCVCVACYPIYATVTMTVYIAKHHTNKANEWKINKSHVSQERTPSTTYTLIVHTRRLGGIGLIKKIKGSNHYSTEIAVNYD